MTGFFIKISPCTAKMFVLCSNYMLVLLHYFACIVDEIYLINLF